MSGKDRKMTRNVKLKIKFRVPFEQVQKIKVISPKGAFVSNITKDGFDIRISLNPFNGNPTKLVYRAGNTIFNDLINPPQFCPACLTVLSTWISVVPIALGRDNKPTPVFPLSVCNFCGCVFVAKDVINQINESRTQKIVIPGKVNLN